MKGNLANTAIRSVSRPSVDAGNAIVLGLVNGRKTTRKTHIGNSRGEKGKESIGVGSAYKYLSVVSRHMGGIWPVWSGRVIIE